VTNWLGLFRWGNVIIALVVVALTALAILGLFVTADGMVERATKRVSDARDAHWTAQIEKSNAEVQRARADQASRALADQVKAQAEIDGLRSQLVENERVNASLPGADACGLDVEVRTVMIRPTLPPIATVPCDAPVARPDRALPAGEVFSLWSADRIALRSCETRRAAAVNAVGGNQ
jgi:hypothetical protein